MLSETEWRSRLTTEQYRILREKATEPPGFSERTPGQLEHELKKEEGTKYPDTGNFSCSGCSTVLYEAKSKFDSG